MLGRAKADLSGASWRLTVHPEDHVRAEEAYRRARNDGHCYVEIRGLRSDGTIVYQSVTVARHSEAHGRFAGFHCLRQDISTYKADQEALMLAVESSPNGLLMLNSAGKIRMINAAVERMFGYSWQELPDLPVETLLSERYRERHRQHRETFNKGRIDEGPRPARAAQGWPRDPAPDLPQHDRDTGGAS